MNLRLRIFSKLLLTLLLIQLSLTGYSQKPKYDSNETKEIIESMLEAHGGMDNWNKAKTLDFSIVMYLANLPVGGETGRIYDNNWRYYTISMELQTNRCYAILPTLGNTYPSLAFDGTDIWMKDYSFDPKFNDGPTGILFFHPGYVTMPWLTQVDGAVLTRLEDTDVPDYGSNIKIRLTYEPSDKEHGGYYDLFIDKETSLLRAVKNTASLPKLPGDFLPEKFPAGQGSGAIFRIFEKYQERNNLTLPVSYTSIKKEDDGSLKVFGSHILINPVFGNQFDENALKKPDDARVVYTAPKS